MVSHDVGLVTSCHLIERIIVQLTFGPSREPLQPAQPAPPRSDTIEGGVGGDSVEPATDIRVVIVCQRAAVEFQERILGHLLRLFRCSNDPDDNTEDSRVVAFEESLECALISAPNALKQRPVGDLVHRGNRSRLYFQRADAHSRPFFSRS